MKAIFFDLDGTLIDSSPDLANSINFMLKQLNKPTFSHEIIKSWVGNGAITLVKRALSSNINIKNINKEEFKKGYEIFMTHYQNNICVDTKMYTNVKDVLEKLKKDYFLTIITNKPYKFVHPILKKLNIDIFDIVLGADSLDEKKPSAKPLLYCLNKLNLQKNEVIMVGDSKNDIIASKKANIKSIAVTYGYNYGENIEKYNPDFIINNLKEIFQCLK